MLIAGNLIPVGSLDNLLLLFGGSYNIGYSCITKDFCQQPQSCAKSMFSHYSVECALILF